jgi:hypothetical protein
MAGLADFYLGADLSGQYNTRLSEDEEAAFEAWRSRLPKRLQALSDYDLRGAWRADARAAANGHLPDTWKKPNHPTFSRESIYSTPSAPGGSWEGNDAAWVYFASPANLKYRPAKALADYFRANEPTSSVVLPIDYSLPRR